MWVLLLLLLLLLVSKPVAVVLRRDRFPFHPRHPRPTWGGANRGAKITSQDDKNALRLDSAGEPLVKLMLHAGTAAIKKPTELPGRSSVSGQTSNTEEVNAQSSYRAAVRYSNDQSLVLRLTMVHHTS